MEKVIDGHIVLFDELDANIFCERRRWRVEKIGSSPYVKWSTSKNGKKITNFLHRMITNAAKGKVVDHINGNGLDNRRCNLRVVTHLENNRNSRPRVNSRSKFKGVSFNRGRWSARIRVSYAHISLGRFDTEVEAAYAYDIASLKYHGEYGLRNFLPLVQ